MRRCPVCEDPIKTELWTMGYRVPDGWPLPNAITWSTCDNCGMLYGDGDFDQAMLDDYYRRFYGYGVNNPANTERLIVDAKKIADMCHEHARILDFGGAGDDGHSILTDTLHALGYANAYTCGAGQRIQSDNSIIYASHVIEHVYDLPDTMKMLVQALAPGGVFIIDVPNSTGLLQRWKKPILDFNTKHLNHFTLRNLLDLGYYHGLEMISMSQYELEVAPCIEVMFQVTSMAKKSMEHVAANEQRMLKNLLAVGEPVNVWGMGDIVWHLMTFRGGHGEPYIEVLDFIDNDPAYRGQTYMGKPVLERPTNDAPIVIMAQGQRERLIANIRAMGIENRIIEI